MCLHICVVAQRWLILRNAAERRPTVAVIAPCGLVLLGASEHVQVLLSSALYGAALLIIAWSCSFPLIDAWSYSKLRSIAWNASPLLNSAKTGWPRLHGAAYYCAILPCVVKLARRPSTPFTLYHVCKQLVCFMVVLTLCCSALVVMFRIDHLSA